MRDSDKSVSEFVLQVNRARNHHRVMALVNAVVDHFGGLQKFARAWLDQVDRMRTRAPTGKKTLDLYRAVIRMMELCQEHEPPPQELDDNQLAEELQTQVQQLTIEHPEIVLRVAEALGWQVTPPVNQQ